MKREKIEKLREAVSCAVILEHAGFAVDLKESTRRAVKFRRGADVIIVTHEGRGWFDPLSDDKGDVFALVCLLERLGFSEAFGRVCDLIGCKAAPILWKKPVKVEPADTLRRWQARRLPATGSSTWRYLCWSRALPIAFAAELSEKRATLKTLEALLAADTDRKDTMPDGA